MVNNIECSYAVVHAWLSILMSLIFPTKSTTKNFQHRCSGFALFPVPRNFHALRSRFVIDETCEKFNISEIITHFSSSMCERVVTLTV